MAKRLRKSAKAKTAQVRVVPKQPSPPAYMFRPHQFENTIELMRQQPRTVFVTRQAYSDMWHFVDIAEDEVGWLGTVRMLPSGSVLIEEVFLLQQEVSAAQTEISEEGIALLADELICNRVDGVETANRIRFWGHSHVNMDTSASQQDENQMKLFKENECPWFVRGIFNKLGRMEFDIFLFENGVVIRDVPWAVYENIDYSARERIEGEFKDKVKERVYQPILPTRYHLEGFEDGQFDGQFPGAREKLASLGYVRFGNQIALNSELSSGQEEDTEIEENGLITEENKGGRNVS